MFIKVLLNLSKLIVTLSNLGEGGIQDSQALTIWVSKKKFLIFKFLAFLVFFTLWSLVIFFGQLINLRNFDLHFKCTVPKCCLKYTTYFDENKALESKLSFLDEVSIASSECLNIFDYFQWSTPGILKLFHLCTPCLPLELLMYP